MRSTTSSNNVPYKKSDYTSQVDALGTLRFLDAVNEVNIDIKFNQASASELLSKAQEVPQIEIAPTYLRSPNGVAKIYAY